MKIPRHTTISYPNAVLAYLFVYNTITFNKKILSKHDTKGKSKLKSTRRLADRHS